ncbi:hypothetical protein HYPSUDRAFT_37445 [Hypholoma sublateritium FD-334 SS-4]|uniref:Ubiquitin-like domain-containing protein n=1 Tax=Hypholoma sublateritium (strain FD-334 SS-4) TaxID=945553 RepID=A0A0D2LDG7_HYPSF|nr:hypothetical protein HYPSUDRAFT_37445 [Hypholoma sublateritium FD-334 SS-4]
MAEQAERAFARTFLNTLATQPVAYADDFQQPPAQSLRRVPVLPIAVPPPPKRSPLEPAGSSSASLSLTFKSLKPPASFTLRVEPTDSIAAIKAQLAALPAAPPAAAQRLLLKGKALADAKLLREYPIAQGDTVNLVLKPGFPWDPTAPNTPAPNTPNTPPQSTPPTTTPDTPMADPATPAKPAPFGFTSSTLDAPARATPKGRHQRIPSVVLSPSPSSDARGAPPEKDIVLTLDAPPSPGALPATLSAFHDVVAAPAFWARLYEFLQTRVQERDGRDARVRGLPLCDQGLAHRQRDREDPRHRRRRRHGRHLVPFLPPFPFFPFPLPTPFFLAPLFRGVALDFTFTVDFS